MHHLVIIVILKVYFTRQLVHGQVWSHDEAEYLPPPDHYDQPKNVRQMFSSLWPDEKLGIKVGDRFTLADSDGSESHLSHQIEHHHSPLYMHIEKPHSRSDLHHPSQLLISSIPSLVLTILTFPMTVTFLFSIVRQLVNLQNTVNQNLVNQIGAESHQGRVSLDKVKNVSENLEKAINKYQLEGE